MEVETMRTKAVAETTPIARERKIAVAFLPPKARKAVEEAVDAHTAAVAALVDLLDKCSDDPDLEDDGSEEPSLGWLDNGRMFGGTDDLESDGLENGEGCVLETHGRGSGFTIDDPDAEPSLARTEDWNQERSHVAKGFVIDGEADGGL
jgi:hypothetical protein